MPYRSPAHGAKPAFHPASLVSRLLAPLREALSLLSLTPRFSGVSESPACSRNRFNGFLAASTPVLFSIILALFPSPARAETEVTDCDLEQAISDAGSGDGIVIFTQDCSITVTNPLIVDGITIDAQGHQVTISGGSQTTIFQLGSGEFDAFGLTITAGSNAIGGALFVDSGATAVFSNCVFIGNQAAGIDGLSGTNGTSGGDGNNGKNATAGTSAFGGAIYNLGTLSLFNCTLSTNTVIGGIGGNGGNGGNGTNSLSHGGNGGTGAGGGSAIGGAIYNLGVLTLGNCTVVGNSATGGDAGTGGSGGTGYTAGRAGSGGSGGVALGGAIYCTNADDLSAVIVTNCTFSDNLSIGGNSTAGGTSSSGDGVNGFRGADSFGGALFVAASPNQTDDFYAAVTNCTFFNDKATGGNGGNGGPGVGTLARGGNGGNGGNAKGGALYAYATAVMNVAWSCTFSQNGSFGGTNGLGGSAYAAGANGAVGTGRGAHLSAAGTSSHFLLEGSLLATNIPGSSTSLEGTIVQDYNISYDITWLGGTHSKKTNNVAIGTLADNGGPTKTIALATNSLARDFIPDTETGFPDMDQRGAPRPSGAGFDAGAYELVLDPTIAVQPQSQTQTNGGSVTFSVLAFGDSLHYQWHFNGTNVGTSRSTYTISNVTVTNQGTYNVTITNKYGSLNSSDATLTVHASPAITVQPTNQVSSVGSNASFSVTATGDPPLTYQWFFNGTNALSGATSSVLALSNVQTSNIGSYSAFITNHYGSLTSSTVRLDMKPAVSNQPVNIVTNAGSTVLFTANAVGSPPLSYQWRRNGADLSGATTNFLSVVSANTNDGVYAILVGNAFGSVTNTIATLTNISPPSIDTQPASQSVSVGSNFVLTVSASGTAPLLYQWQHNGTNLAGATTSSFSVSNAQTNDSGNYRVAVSNSYGFTNSATAVVTVTPLAPVITAQPVSQTVPVDRDVSLFVGAIGASPLTYQWRYNNSPILGGGGPSYSITGVQPEDAGSYDVIVGNSYGSVRSSKAVLKVFTPASISQPLLASNNFILTFPSQTGFTYTVQYSSDPRTNAWNTLVATNGTGATIIVKDPLLAQPARFYRVIIQ